MEEFCQTFIRTCCQGKWAKEGTILDLLRKNFSAETSLLVEFEYLKKKNAGLIYAIFFFICDPFYLRVNWDLGSGRI